MFRFECFMKNRRRKKLGFIGYLQEISRGKGLQSLWDYGGTTRKVKRNFDHGAAPEEATVLTGNRLPATKQGTDLLGVGSFYRR